MSNRREGAGATSQQHSAPKTQKKACPMTTKTLQFSQKKRTTMITKTFYIATPEGWQEMLGDDEPAPLP